MNPLGEKEIVSLDFETTGLDPNFDAITEIGALLAVDGEIVDKYSTLVNPGKTIPFPIKRLTGIDDEMVANAPDEKSALKGLLEFVGDRPILGQNVDFDIGFFTTRCVKHDLPVWSGKRIDTKPIAAVLYPRLSGYGLSNLATLFKIEFEAPHRAWCDAGVTFEVAKALWGKLISLEKTLFELLYRLGRSSGDMDLISWFSPAQKSEMLGKLAPPLIDENQIACFNNIIGSPTEPGKCEMTENDVLGFLGP